MTISKEKVIIFWGIMDLAIIGRYAIIKITKGQIPFYSDFISAKAISVSFEYPFPLILAAITLALYLSLFLSGYLLIKRNKFGALLSYFQCPFRLLSIIPPSLFFLTWPIKYIFGEVAESRDPIQIFMQAPVIVLLALVLLSEILKTTTVVRWHLKIRGKV